MSILGKLNDVEPREWDRLNEQSLRVKGGLCPPTDTQIGGNHYKNYKIQPIEYTLANSLNFCQGNVIKYITRYKDKNGVEDLKKAKHYIDILISEYAKFEEEERKYEEDNGFY